MGVKIYNEADLKIVQKLKAAAAAEAKTTVDGITRIEDTSLALSEAVATMYEDSLKRNIQTDEVLATIYENTLKEGELS